MPIPLPYTLRTRYRSIAIAWTVILIPPVVINLSLFYGLWYGQPQLDRILVLTLPTAILGVFTAVAIVERIYKLIQKSPEFRPAGSPRYALDIFQWGYFGALIIISALISSALARGDADNDGHELQIRLVSLPAALLMFYLATLTLLSLILNWLQTPLPFRFGSLPAGNALRPALYYIIEDVVAVDGNGGMAFRIAFKVRYESSAVFRSMLWRLSVMWMLAFYGLTALFTALVMKLPWQAVYAVGWAGPFPCAGVLAVGTIWYVKYMLAVERKQEEGVQVDGSQEGNERTPLLGGGT